MNPKFFLAHTKPSLKIICRDLSHLKNYFPHAASLTKIISLMLSAR